MVLLLAILVGGLAGALSYMVDHSVPTALLWGGGAAGSALLLFHSVIEV
ncbi:hypothetical protein AB0C15_21670 [Micromonospora sp. NPDC048835]